jgi:hypothetical protein
LGTEIRELDAPAAIFVRGSDLAGGHFSGIFLARSRIRFPLGLARNPVSGGEVKMHIRVIGLQLCGE